MRHTLSALTFFALVALAAPAAFAQRSPNPSLSIRLYVEPANPTTADEIKLYFFATTANQGLRLNTSFSTTNNRQVTFTGCYAIGTATQQAYFRDTVNAGHLMPGSYTVSFIGVESVGGSQPCVGGRRDTVSLTFQVRAPLATTRAGDGWAVYPTPATGGALSLLIPSDKKVTAITLLDAVGRPCYASAGTTLLPEGGHWRLALPTLPTGAYTLQLGVAGGAVVSQRVLLE